jgi:hypothetical protein
MIVNYAVYEKYYLTTSDRRVITDVTGMFELYEALQKPDPTNILS